MVALAFASTVIVLIMFSELYDAKQRIKIQKTDIDVSVTIKELEEEISMRGTSYKVYYR